MSRIFLTGDVHRELEYQRFSTKKWPLGKTLSGDDYLIVLGDFGLIWDLTETKTEIYLKKWFNEKPWTTLFIDGNHENHDRLNKLENTKFLGGNVGVISNSIFHLRRGEIYTINNQKFLTIGGATSTDKQHRIENFSWWKEEVLNYKDQEYIMENLEKNQFSVDHILAHTLPDTLANIFGYLHFDSNYNCSVRKFLDYVIQVTKFRHFWCGHWHDEKNINKFHVLYQNIIEIT
jgi:hypothetical protein